VSAHEAATLETLTFIESGGRALPGPSISPLLHFFVRLRDHARQKAIVLRQTSGGEAATNDPSRRYRCPTDA
jgi:hypothetical protein